MINIKLVNIPEDRSQGAVSLAYVFNRQYPNRMGLRSGCGYLPDDGGVPLYVYRTKTQIVVRGQP